MGADLITYILVGPVKLKRSKKLQAQLLKQANHIVGAAKQALKDPDFDWCDDPFLSEFEEEDLDSVAAINPEAVLEDLFQLWEGSSFRDVSVRDKRINGKAVRIVVAGGESWGDEPDGAGYATIRNAIKLDMLDALGID
jgi:hypothetical protein